MADYTNSEMRALIEEHLHSQRDREILYERLINGLTFEKLAEKMDLSVRYVKTIVYKSEKILFRHLEK